MSNLENDESLERAFEDARVKIKMTIEVDDSEIGYHPEIETSAYSWYEDIGENLARKITDTLHQTIVENWYDREPADYDSIIKYEDN